MIKVLLIEDRTADEIEVSARLGRTRRESFEVTPAASMDAAIERLADETFDVVLLELRLAGGDEATELVRLKDLTPTLPVVLLCTQDENDAAIRALDLGAEDYVVHDHGTPELLARSILFAIERASAAARLALFSTQDPLTGLVGGALFRDRIAEALARSERSGRPGAIFVVNVDALQTINEEYGNAVGDLLLQHVASRLRNSVRPYDVVSRLGGDVFGVLLEEFGEVGDAVRVARRMTEAIAAPLVASGNEILGTASIGGVLFPADGTDPRALLRNAGFALDRAKRQGGDTAAFYAEVFGGAFSTRIPIAS